MEQKPIQSNYDAQVDIGRAIFLEYDQAQLIRKFHLEADEQWIYLTYFQIPCRISRENGQIDLLEQDGWRECRAFNTVMTIYDLLCYHRGETMPPLYGQWCTVGTFIITGVSNTGTFTKKYAALFSGHLDALREACIRLGGVPEKPMAGADLTCRIQVTPFFPVLLQFREGDDEFAPMLQILWDRNACSFLHFESTFYLQGDLLGRIREKMGL